LANFIGYTIFSGFEYCGAILLMLSLFNYRIVKHKKEYFFLVITATLISYAVTMIYFQVVSLVVILYIIFYFHQFFRIKLMKSVIMTVGGFVIYIAMQFGISVLAIHYNYLVVSDMNNPFALKTYVMQTLSMTIALTISFYLKTFRRGFGFSLRSKKRPYHRFLFIAIISLILPLACFLAFTLTLKQSLFQVCGVMFIVSSITVLFLFYQEDNAEYSIPVEELG
jgi:hypothetical protein